MMNSENPGFEGYTWHFRRFFEGLRHVGTE